MEFERETTYYTSEVYQEDGDDTSYLITYKKWSGMSFVVCDLDTGEQNHEDEEYFTHSLPGNPSMDESGEYLKEHYQGRVVNIHFYRYLTFDYTPSTGGMFECEYESGETYVDKVYITEDGKDIIYV